MRRVFTDEWALENRRFEDDRVTGRARYVYEAVHESGGRRWEFAVPSGSSELTRWEVIYAFHAAQKARRRPNYRNLLVRPVVVAGEAP